MGRCCSGWPGPSPNRRIVGLSSPLTPKVTSLTFAGDRGLPSKLLSCGGPLDIKAPLCNLAISGVGPGTTAPGLLVQVLFAHDAADFEITTDNCTFDMRNVSH